MLGACRRAKAIRKAKIPSPWQVTCVQRPLNARDCFVMGGLVMSTAVHKGSSECISLALFG